MSRHSVFQRIAFGIALCVYPLLSAPAQQMAMFGPRLSVVAEIQPDRGLQTVVSVALANVSLGAALDELSRVANVPLMYSKAIVPVNRIVSINVKNVSLQTALTQLLKGTGMDVRLSPEGRVMIVRSENVQAQAGTIVGKVVNARTKQPLVGASVRLGTSAASVLTDENGAFRLSAAAGDHTVDVRAIGFTRESVRVTVPEGETVTIQVLMEASANVLDEVIVTGTVVPTERRAVPNPITVITAEDIERRGITRIDQLFRGEIPGVTALEQGMMFYANDSLGRMAGSQTQIFSRGSSSIVRAGNTPPGNPLKTFVDGVEIVDSRYLGTIDPQSIEKIEVIAGPQAATIYGSGAMGGVMQIFTKRGSGSSTPEVTLSLQYGMLETNVSSGRAPSHRDVLNIRGGSGAEFSYAGNLSYNYVGQWQPKLFSRGYGASIGATYTTGSVTASGNASVTSSENGTAPTFPLVTRAIGEGDYRMETLGPGGRVPSQRIATSSNQILSLNVDYRPSAFWNHHLTVGRSQIDFKMEPQSPQWGSPADTLFRTASTNGMRTTYGYNTTVRGQVMNNIAGNFTVGVNGSQGDRTQVAGCIASKSSTSYIDCPLTVGERVTVTRPLDAESFGGFGTGQIGVFNRLFLTAGLRGERNPNYGKDHRIDWTPTTGITYAMEFGDLTMKVMGSYGRATRPPLNDQRLQLMRNDPTMIPSSFIRTFANDSLRPERSRGPQMGIELYYGNRGSLTINRFDQKVTDLIQEVVVDSVFVTIISNGFQTYQSQYQWVNAASIRQQGWEGTASVNLGALSLKGTYSWTDSRITKVAPSLASQYPIGQAFTGVPTHTGNVLATYAHGGTSVTLSTNFTGKTLRSGSAGTRSIPLFYDFTFSRIKSYLLRGTSTTAGYAEDGDVKSNLVISQRITPWASATMNVQNLGNSFGTDVNVLYPALGRQTMFGVSLRYPSSR